jgi:hypothetical protein
MAQQTSGKLTLPFMILAFLGVVAFLYWLSVVSEPTELLIAEEEEEPAMEFGLGTFQERIGELEGERVRLDEVTVASRITVEAFFIQLPDGTPYLVRMLPRLVAGGVTVVEGDVLEVTGRVHAMADSVLDDWEQSGALRDPVARDMAEVSESFLEVDRVEFRTGPDDPEDPDQDPPAED